MNDNFCTVKNYLQMATVVLAVADEALGVEYKYSCRVAKCHIVIGH